MPELVYYNNHSLLKNLLDAEEKVLDQFAVAIGLSSMERLKALDQRIKAQEEMEESNEGALCFKRSCAYNPYYDSEEGEIKRQLIYKLARYYDKDYFVLTHDGIPAFAEQLFYQQAQDHSENAECTIPQELLGESFEESVDILLQRFNEWTNNEYLNKIPETAVSESLMPYELWGYVLTFFPASATSLGMVPSSSVSGCQQGVNNEGRPVEQQEEANLNSGLIKRN